jgi:hypothetical protein
MPFAGIGPGKDAAAERVRIGSQAACGAMTGSANVPVNGKFQIEYPRTLVNPIAREV